MFRNAILIMSVWAAHEVWGEAIKEVVAVEPSEAMMTLGEGLHAVRKESMEKDGSEFPNIKCVFCQQHVSAGNFCLLILLTKL